MVISHALLMSHPAVSAAVRSYHDEHRFRYWASHLWPGFRCVMWLRGWVLQGFCVLLVKEHTSLCSTLGLCNCRRMYLQLPSACQNGSQVVFWRATSIVHAFTGWLLALCMQCACRQLLAAAVAQCTTIWSFHAFSASRTANTALSAVFVCCAVQLSSSSHSASSRSVGVGIYCVMSNHACCLLPGWRSHAANAKAVTHSSIALHTVSLLHSDHPTYQPASEISSSCWSAFSPVQEPAASHCAYTKGIKHSSVQHCGNTCAVVCSLIFCHTDPLQSGGGPCWCAPLAVRPAAWVGHCGFLYEPYQQSGHLLCPAPTARPVRGGGSTRDVVPPLYILPCRQVW